MDRVSTGLDADEVFEELVSIRADFALRHAFDGFGMEYDQALELIRNKENLTPEQNTEREILLAAVDNLIDFATVEEYHAVSETIDFLDNEELEHEDDGMDEEEREEAILAICAKYNRRYANTENHDIEYAMIVAAQLSALSDDSYLMYMTMGDERVRPWHLQYEGFTAPKSSFPAWLVPPIEHQCRCYLIEDGKPTSQISDIKAQRVQIEPPYWFNPTFKECVAFGGRIFSDEHPYFTIDESHKGRLKEISERIKSHYLNA